MIRVRFQTYTDPDGTPTLGQVAGTFELAAVPRVGEYVVLDRIGRTVTDVQWWLGAEDLDYDVQVRLR